MEKILVENPNRFVIFPIEHNDIWEFYKKAEQVFWTAENPELTIFATGHILYYALLAAKNLDAIGKCIILAIKQF